MTRGTKDESGGTLNIKKPDPRGAGKDAWGGVARRAEIKSGQGGVLEAKSRGVFQTIKPVYNINF